MFGVQKFELEIFYFYLILKFFFFLVETFSLGNAKCLLWVYNLIIIMILFEKGVSDKELQIAKFRICIVIVKLIIRCIVVLNYFS